MKICESGVLPAAHKAATSRLLLADGFRCRAPQIEQDANRRRALHLAEALTLGLNGPLPSNSGEN